MQHSQFGLLKKRRFLPLFVTQFFGAFNDNAFKLAVLTLISYHLAANQTDSEYYQAMAAGIFILPFFLFSATAGQLADKFDKARIVFIVKILEVVLMIIGGLGLYFGHIQLMMVTLFGMGVHSTFFGPVKYSILPQHLKEDEIIGGNGLIEASTFIAILLGTVLGTLSIGTDTQNVMWAIMLTISAALIGLASSYFILPAKAYDSGWKVDFNLVTATKDIVLEARKNKDIFLAILAISWFWLFGSVILTKLPDYTHYVLDANTSVFAIFLAIFSIGIAIGSLLVNKLLSGIVTATFVPLGVLGLSFFTIDLYFASPSTHTTGTLLGVYAFFENLNHIRIAMDLFLIALCGGIFIVPLYAMIQVRSDANVRSRIIAANNIINAFFMVIASLMVMVLAEMGFSIPQVLFILALLNTVVAFFACRFLPEAIMKSFVKWLFQLVYSVDVNGLEHYLEAKGSAVIIANHTSYIDILLLSSFLPDKFMIAVNTDIAKKWWVKPLLQFVEAHPIDSTKPMAAKSIIKQIKKGKKCVIFPEGRLTVTGSLMKVYQGSGMICEKSDATLIPIRIDGAMYTPFTRMRGKVRIRFFPKITLTILPQRNINLPKSLPNRVRRQKMSMHLYQLMTNMLFDSSPTDTTLLGAIYDAKKIHGKHRKIIEDTNRTPLSYQRLLINSFVLGEAFKVIAEQNVGVILPTSTLCLTTVLALHSQHRTPVMLNYTLGINKLQAALSAAGVNTIITSREFIKTIKLTDTVEKLTHAGINFIEIDAQSITLLKRVKGFLRASWVNKPYAKKNANNPCVILFTSGAQGQPKGVVLSHKNILSNCYQMSSRIDLTCRDVLFSPLPLFHSFGFTIGAILPLVTGIRTFFYPSPLHYRIIPELAYDTNATILLGTNTFLSHYARYAHLYDFYSLRYVFACAEKIKEKTAREWSEKFGVRIFESYGSTETASVIATNTPMMCKKGTSGAMLPGIEVRFERINTIQQGGRLLVRGPNVMLGYLMPKRPGEFMMSKTPWYDTEDIVSLDEQGYLHILGRFKRFAKKSGRMISLASVESYIDDCWMDAENAVIAIKNEKADDELVLFTTEKAAQLKTLAQFVKKYGVSEVMLPETIKIIEKLPMKAFGKVDYERLVCEFALSNEDT